MRVGLATGDWAYVLLDDEVVPCLHACGWIRLGQYSVGSRHETVIGRLIWDPKEEVFGIADPTPEPHFGFDIIVANYMTDKNTVEYIRRANKSGQVFVSDTDDWHWDTAASRSQLWHNTQPQADADSNVLHLRKVLAASNAVICSTPFLLDRLDWVDNKKKYLHENHLDFSQYPKWVHRERRKPVVGWAGYTGLRAGDLDILKGFYPTISEEFAFHHSGHQPGDNHTIPFPFFADKVGLSRDLVSTTPSSAYVGTFRETAFRFDIGVVPLVKASCNMAKSWLKGLEYAAAGIPFVASSVGEYRRLHELYGVGRLAEKIPDWKKHLRALKSPEARQREAAENLERLKPLDLSVGTKKWDDLIESLA